MASKIIWQNSYCYLTLFEGQMADLHQRSETVITGGGHHIGSYTNTLTQIFIIDKQGNQYTFGTMTWDIPMRVGNDLKVMTICRNNWANGEIVLAQNISLNQISWSSERLKSAIKRVYFPFLKWGLVTLFVIPFILYFVLFVFIQPEPNSFIDTIFSLLMNVCQLGGFGSIIYGYHFCWRKAYSQANKSLAINL